LQHSNRTIASCEAVVSHDVAALPKQCLLFRFNTLPFSERTERRGDG